MVNEDWQKSSLHREEGGKLWRKRNVFMWRNLCQGFIFSLSASLGWCQCKSKIKRNIANLSFSFSFSLPCQIKFPLKFWCAFILKRHGSIYFKNICTNLKGAEVLREREKQN